MGRALSLFIFLSAIIGPLLRKALIFIGIGTITFVGMDAVLSQIITGIQNSLGGLTGDYLAFSVLLGVPEGLSIIAGGFSIRVAMIALKRFGLL